jgi:preprotein translocase subunit SecE
MTRDLDIEPVTASGAIRSIGIVIVLCFIALLLILGFEFLFFWEMDFIK